MGKKHKKHKSSWKRDDDYVITDKTPLKLVLKLGAEVMYDSDQAVNSPASSGLHDESSSTHKRKKRKKKRHRDEDQESNAPSPALPSHITHSQSPTNEPDINVSPAEAKALPSPMEEQEQMDGVEITESSNPPPIKPVTVQIAISKDVTPKLPMSKRKQTALNNLLEHILKQLERKDPHDIFAWPVNDLIAPGYSSVIDHPMDFSTMRNKINTNQYQDINEFKADFELITNNCCTYNKPDTVYYNSAKKLLSAGMKIMSKERLKTMKRSLTSLSQLSKRDASDVLGLQQPTEGAVDAATSVQPELTIFTEKGSNDSEREDLIPIEEELDLRSHPDAVSFTDADNEDSVAPDVILAMKMAQKRLAEKRPKDKVGFLSMDHDGKTTLNFINPDYGEPSVCEVDLGSLTSHLVDGIDVMPEPKEDKRNKVTPIQYLGYGPFSSFAPTFDSRISNLTQEESDLLLSAYGGETGYMHASSMQEFVSNCDKGLVRMVGDLLDAVTHGAHSQAYQDIADKRKKQRKSPEEKTNSTNEATIDFEKLRSLKELGIDVSFLDEVEANRASFRNKENNVKDNESPDIEDKLDKGSILINKLEAAQYKRLSAKPANNEPNLQPPTDKERAIAAELQQTLADLTATASPRMVCDQSGLHQALGVVSTT